VLCSDIFEVYRGGLKRNMSLEVFAVTFVEYCVDEKFAGVSFQVRK